MIKTCRFPLLMMGLQIDVNKILLYKRKQAQLTKALDVLRSNRKKYLLFRKSIFNELKLLDSKNHKLFVKLNVIERASVLMAAVRAWRKYPLLIKEFAKAL